MVPHGPFSEVEFAALTWTEHTLVLEPSHFEQVVAS